MTNEIKKVCITDEQSAPYNATNSTEVEDYTLATAYVESDTPSTGTDPLTEL
jgi:hypothetical protein